MTVEKAIFEAKLGCPCGLQYPKLRPPQGWFAKIRPLTSAQFERLYARRSGVTVEFLREQGRVVIKCGCDDDFQCLGWVSMSKDQAEDYINNMPGLYGYRWPEERE